MKSIESIFEVHSLMGLAPPSHPLVSVIPVRDLPREMVQDERIRFDLFFVSLKDGITGSMGYGRNSYDYEDGTMIFSKAGQVLQPQHEIISDDAKGWVLLFHPDLIRRSDLGRSIGQYTFFDYETHEALHLSEKEQQTVTEIVAKIRDEYERPIDKHSQKLIVSNITLLLDYCTRYYDRQFIIRTDLNQDLMADFEVLLRDYFESENPKELGLPTVKFCGQQLGLSPKYLSDLLKKESGKSAKEHIDAFVINRAKNQLLGSSHSIGEIAFDLGFEYSQHFSKLFKKRTGMSPKTYRQLN
ncbi:helix-turn-helix domain-containing protein [Sediminicola luteus]|uniref:AraC family transcriptional regulator n=1 Tax=Sediminicola luteus TaxID=319238 RepID=A0A2A4G7N9_9FLAO|nr:helix-turn-helix domain-containing protein [Sediminicola luteus]PCE63765.1 AraC family transcriptional regulator [Sediminicola luteus]